MKMKKLKNGKKVTMTVFAMTLALATSSVTFADETNDKYVLGDLNGDRVVDVKDNALLKRYLAGWDIKFVSYGHMDEDDSKQSGESKETIDQRSIPADAKQFNANYYYIFAAESWEAANQWCDLNGGHLAVITSEEENIFVQDYIKEKDAGTVIFGLNDLETDNIWQWVNGEKYEYSNWRDGQPETYRSEYYACFSGRKYDYKWDDSISRKGNYICEWEALKDDAAPTTLTFRNENGGDFIKDVSQVTLKFNLNQDSREVVASIVDVDNSVVYSHTFSNCKSNTEYSFQWDGKNADGVSVDSGVYRVIVKAGTIETPSESVRYITKSDFSGGDGSESNPYLVSDLEQLKKVGNNSTKHFKQISNINGNYETFEVMGASDVPFKGHYDGNGYKILNLVIKDAIFYQLEKDCIIENMVFEGCSVSSSINYNVGVLAKYNSGTVTNCTFNKCTVIVNGEKNRAGIVCGSNDENGNIKNCSIVDCIVSATGTSCYAGGICGYNNGKIVSSSGNKMDISASNGGYTAIGAGGVAGYNDTEGFISFCDTDGTITSTVTSWDSYSYAGGIVAWNYGHVLHCTSNAKVVVPAYGHWGKIFAAGDGVVENE